MEQKVKPFTTPDIVAFALFNQSLDFKRAGSQAGEPNRESDDYVGETKHEIIQHVLGADQLYYAGGLCLVDAEAEKKNEERTVVALMEQFSWLEGVVEDGFYNVLDVDFEDEDSFEEFNEWMDAIVKKHGMWHFVEQSSDAALNKYIEQETKAHNLFDNDFGLN